MLAGKNPLEKEALARRAAGTRNRLVQLRRGRKTNLIQRTGTRKTAGRRMSVETEKHGTIKTQAKAGEEKESLGTSPIAGTPLPVTLGQKTPAHKRRDQVIGSALHAITITSQRIRFS